jgi:HEAT repeat protein
MKKSGQHMQQGTHPRAVILMLLIGLAFVDRITSSGLFGHNVKKLKNARNIPALVAALHHNDPDVQFEAAEALGDIGDQAAVEPLATVLKTSEFSGVRWKAAEALSKLGDAAVPHLIPALSHQDEDVRWKSAIALGEIGNPESIGPLIALLCDRDRFVRSRAAYALGLLGEPAIEPLIHLLRDGDVSRRWGAALALGKIQDPRVIEPLIRALADRHESVRAESAASLCRWPCTA